VTQTVSKAVAQRDTSPAAMVEQYRQDFALVLPSHIKPDAWVRVVQGVVRRDPKLYEAATADPGSLVVALMDAARQGLEPGTEQYYLTVRKVKAPNGQKVPQVKGIRGYQGEIELIYRAGAVSSVILDVVRDNDTFVWTAGATDVEMIGRGLPPRWDGPQERPLHIADWFGDRGALKGVYAYAIMKDGLATSKVVVLNKADIDAARASSDSAGYEWSPWQKHEAAMWLKTGVHRLQKFVPTSAEYMREQMRAARDVAAEPVATVAGPPMSPPPTPPEPLADRQTGEVVDAELLDDPAGT
jgi:recombination protein RecT